MSIASFLKTLVPAATKTHMQPMDKTQLDAAQERLTQRKDELDKEIDEFTKMVRRMKRKGRAK